MLAHESLFLALSSAKQHSLPFQLPASRDRVSLARERFRFSFQKCIILQLWLRQYERSASLVRRIIEKVGLQSIFSRPKNDSTSLQNSLFEHNSESRSASKRRKTAQLRSKTASSTQYNSVLVVTSQSLRGHFAVTSRSHRGHNAVTTVTTRSLRGHYGHYAVTTVTTRSERAHIRD